MQYFLSCAATLTLLAFADTANALDIKTGIDPTVSASSIVGGLVYIFLLWSSLVTTALFLLGCVLMVASGGNDALLSNGKKIMKASLIGYTIILSSWLILSTVVYFVGG